MFLTIRLTMTIPLYHKIKKLRLVRLWTPEDINSITLLHAKSIHQITEIFNKLLATKSVELPLRKYYYSLTKTKEVQTTRQFILTYETMLRKE